MPLLTSLLKENKHYEEKDDLVYKKVRRMKLKARKNREGSDRLKVLERRGREMFIKEVNDVE